MAGQRRQAGLQGWALLLGCLLCLGHVSAQNSLYASTLALFRPDIAQMMNTIMSQARPSVVMGVRAVAAAPVLAEFFNAINGAGTPAASDGSGVFLSGALVPPANYTPGMLQVPLAFAKITLIHSIPPSNISGVLNLTQCVMAGIYSRTIRTWDDPSILRINPNLNVPPGTPITPYGSPEYSPTVESLANYIAWGCAPSPSPWTLGVTPLISAWPAGITVLPGVDAVVRRMSPVSPAFVPYGVVGLDSAYVYSFNKNSNLMLEEAALQLGNGSFVTAANADTVAVQSIITATPAPNYPPITGDWASHPIRWAFLNGSMATGWPITLPLVALVQQDVTARGAQGSLLRALLTFALSPAGQAIVGANYHVPLPRAVADDLSSQLRQLLNVSASAPEWTFEDGSRPVSIAGAGEYVISAYRETYLSTQAAMVDQLIRQVNLLNQRVATLEVTASLAAADRAAAAVDRSRINATVKDIAEAESKAETANNIAIAGVVLAVLLAVVALIVAVVYIVRTKKLDQKYSKYLPLGVKARFDDTPENLATRPALATSGSTSSVIV